MESASFITEIFMLVSGDREKGMVRETISIEKGIDTQGNGGMT